MIYVQADLAPDAIRWAMRLSLRTPGFCNACIAHSMQNMERGLTAGRQQPPVPWDLVKKWLLRQGKAVELNLPSTTLRRVQAQQQAEYRQTQGQLKDFERDLLAGNANTRVVFQVYEGNETGKLTERWPAKIRRMAEHFQIKPNELVNRMIAAGVSALEQEELSYEPDFVSQYRREVVIPRIEQLRSERLLADQFDTHADVPSELVSDGWAFMSLNENANLHHRELVDGFLEGKGVEETLSFISADRTLSPEYVERLKGIYLNPAYKDWDEDHPLRDKKLKKEIIDAWVDEWLRRRSSPLGAVSEVEEIKSRLSGLTDTELMLLEKEIKTIKISRRNT